MKKKNNNWWERYVEERDINRTYTEEECKAATEEFLAWYKEATTQYEADCKKAAEEFFTWWNEVTHQE